MKVINPMNKIAIAMSCFGFFVGIIFAIVVNYFRIYMPEKSTIFNISCVIAGIIVGICAFLVISLVLNKIDKRYKTIIELKLGVKVKYGHAIFKSDAVISMQKEFEMLIDEFVKIKKREDERLKKLAITDELTQLYNTRFLEEYITNASRGKIGIAFFDIDHFKNINDSFGHNIGDLVLKLLGNLMKEFVGGKGKVFRYGGEEFLILLENYSLEETIRITEELRVEIKKNISVPDCNENKSITASVGIAHSPTHGTELKELINKADKAMYDAKKQGRDRCFVYEEGVS